MIWEMDDAVTMRLKLDNAGESKWAVLYSVFRMFAETPEKIQGCIEVIPADTNVVHVSWVGETFLVQYYTTEVNTRKKSEEAILWVRNKLMAMLKKYQGENVKGDVDPDVDETQSFPHIQKSTANN